MGVLAALHARTSVRGFRLEAVDRATVEAVLAAASRSPSASNTQPWRVYVCMGDVRERLSRDLLAAHAAGGDAAHDDYRYYPTSWADPYLARRRQVGKALYRLLGIAKGDDIAMGRQYARNYEFFDAPVGLFFTLDRRLDGQAAWLDLGIFLHGVMLAALGHGLDTCAQQAFARYHKVVRRHIEIPDSEVLVCGMSMGHADEHELANRLCTAREPVAAFVRFYGN